MTSKHAITCLMMKIIRSDVKDVRRSNGGSAISDYLVFPAARSP